MGKKVVCAGTFDHFHPGHRDFLRQAKTLGEVLTVIVARDETVRRIKGFLPTHCEQVRKRNVEESGIPELVILGNLDTDLFQIIQELKPDVIALGYDQRVSEEEILKRFPSCTIVRLISFEPDQYKSSFYRQRNNG
ncbi:MAG TPA: adenylyltransferase/cytidyltransferase family protein [Dissulfurispiraceae bacterium]|nr:adenylyltransferase/cytidyltransferase family protein [Dissulfurispiraceae bacterium]